MHVTHDRGDHPGPVTQPAAGDPATVLGGLAAPGRPVGVDAHHRPGDRQRDLAVPHRGQPVGQVGVDPAPVCRGEVTDPVGDQLGAVLVDVAALQRGQGVREVVDQRHRQPGQPPAPVRALVAGQPDLRPHRPGRLTGVHDRRGDPCLRRTRRGLQPLQRLEPVDPRRRVHGHRPGPQQRGDHLQIHLIEVNQPIGTVRRVEHVFEYMADTPACPERVHV